MHHKCELWFEAARQMLLLLQCLRGVMMGGLVAFIPTHVAFVRSDAVSIVLDAIAAMFILDVDTKVMKLLHPEGFQRDLFEERTHELRMSPKEKALLEEGKWGVAAMCILAVIVLPCVASRSASSFYYEQVGSMYFGFVTSMLVLAMVVAELRATHPRAAGDTRMYNVRLVRWSFVLLRWAIAGIVWALVLFCGMLQLKL